MEEMGRVLLCAPFFSTVVLAVLVYVVPVLGWLVQPVVLRPQSARVRSRPLIEP